MELSGDPTELLVLERIGGGYSQESWQSAGLPTFALYADGRVILGPPNAYSYELRQTKISAEAAADLLAGLDDLGLFSHEFKIDGGVADADVQILELRYGDHIATHTVNPAGSAEGDDLAAGLDLLAEYKPPSAQVTVEDEMPLEYAMARYDASKLTQCEGAMAWPEEYAFPGLDAQETSCVMLPVIDAPRIPESPEADVWTAEQEGMCLRVVFRPVLPHDPGCPEQP